MKARRCFWSIHWPPTSSLFFVWLLVLALPQIAYSASNNGPTDPSGDAGALKPQVETGSSYNPENGNGSRVIPDLRVPGAVGAYGLDFNRYWNSTSGFTYMSDPGPQPFGPGGWTHSWVWTASYDYTDMDHCEDGACHGNCYVTVAHMVKVNYGDGRSATFKFYVRDCETPSGDPYNDVSFPPAFGGNIAIDDHLAGMDPEGTHFWLYLRDGGAAYFEGSRDSGWRATKIIDPNGLVTELQYEPDLLRVVGPDGRSLRISGKYLPNGQGVIGAVEAGAGAGLQRVEYDYSSYATEGRTWYALSGVRYLGDLDPTTGQPVAARYDYTPWVSKGPTGASLKGQGPLLSYADDPRYAGPMTLIRYIFRGGPGGEPFCPYPNVQSPPSNPGPRLNMAAFPVEQELSGKTALLVSKLFLPCNDSPQIGTRTETRGAGGQRKFYYQSTAGLEPGAYYTTDSNNNATWYPPEAESVNRRGYGGLVHEPNKLTDFADDPATAPSDFNNPKWVHPWRRFDRRGTLTQFIFADPFSANQAARNGRLKEIWYRGADNINNNGSNKVSVKTYNWDNPGNSAARDANRIPNTYNHWLFSQTDERNFTTTYIRDSLRRITRINYPDTSSEEYTYNGLNQVLTHTLPTGAVENFVYDANNRLFQEWNSVDGFDARKEYTYDAFDRVRTMQDGRARAAGKAFSVQMDYNARHQVTKVTYPSTGGGANPAVTYEYDKYSNCTAITNELGHRSTYTYDSYRRCTSYTEPVDAPTWDGTNVPSRTWEWVYDRVNGSVQADASTHTSKNWRLQIQPAFGSTGKRRVTQRTYDYNDRLKVEQTGGIETAPGVYDFGNPDAETHSYTYDANGNKASYKDPLNRVTSYEYDKRDRPTKTIEPLGRTTTTEYDVTGNKTKVIFPDNYRQQWFDYDAFGKPGQFMDERSNITYMGYWSWGPMKKMSDLTTIRDKDSGGTENQRTEFFYDGMTRLWGTHFPDNSWETTSFEFGQPKTFTTRKGAQKTINYDARGREISHTWNDSATPGINRAWDDAHRLLTLSNTTSTINYTYDKAAQVTSESSNVSGGGGPAVLAYSRYPNGAAAKITYPSGFILRRDYTAREQLAAVGSADSNGGWMTKFAQYNYLSDGKLNYEDYGNGVRTTFGYDERGFVNLTNTSRLSPAQIYSKRTYYRDNRDRIFAWAKSNTPANNPLENGRGDRYTYDTEGQLTGASYQALTPNTTPSSPQRSETFLYDQLGNRYFANQLAGRGTVMFYRDDNGLNQYLGWTGSAINHDDDIGPPWGSPGLANGVTMQEGWITGGYNALNQLYTVWSPTVPGGAFETFGYDPLGRCVKRQPGGGAAPLFLYYDGWNLIQEGPNSVTADRIYAHGNRVDEIVASQAGGQWFYHHYDARGHSILATDASGNLVEQYDYDAFGKPYFYNGSGTSLPNGSSIGNRFLFTGREWLTDLKLYDYRNRVYQPELGRFLQPDPKHFEAGDYNLYRYCHNDPVNKMDPLGLIDFEFSRDYPADDRARVMAAIAVGRSTERGNQLLSADPGRTITIVPTTSSRETGSQGDVIALNPKDRLFLDSQSRRDFSKVPNELPPANDKGRAVIVMHEVGHAVTGEPDEHKGGQNVRRNENPVRRGLGIPDRRTYGGHPIPDPPRDKKHR